MVPSEKVFDNDAGAKKMKGDQLTTYKLRKLEELGYLDFASRLDMCTATFGDDAKACQDGDEAMNAQAVEAFAAKGYEIKELKSGEKYAMHTYRWYELLWRFYSTNRCVREKLIPVKIENPR